jgi:undecaprenyl-diphosphatase
MSKKSKMFALGLMLIVFLTIGFMVKGTNEGILFDVKVMDYIHSKTNQLLLGFMKFISFIGSEKFLIPTIAIIVLYNLIKKKNYIPKLLVLSTLGSYLLNFLLKQFFQRSRPFDYFLVNQGGLSYPSGHSMVTMTLYSTIAFLLAKKTEKDWEKRLIHLLSLVIICLMGISRLYLGVHWPTDVIGGYLMGYIFYSIITTTVKE